MSWSHCNRFRSLSVVGFIMWNLVAHMLRWSSPFHFQGRQIMDLDISGNGAVSDEPRPLQLHKRTLPARELAGLWSLSVCLSLSHTHSHSRSPSRYLPLTLPPSLPLSLSSSLSLSIFLYLLLSHSHSVNHSLTHSLSLSLILSLLLTLSRPLSLSLSLSLPRSLSLSLSLSLAFTCCSMALSGQVTCMPMIRPACTHAQIKVGLVDRAVSIKHCFA